MSLSPSPPFIAERAQAYLRRSAALLNSIRADQLAPLLHWLAVMRMEQSGVAWIIGNGGSQANASHLVLHLREHSIRAHDLLAETANLTAISNDHDYVKVASRTLRTLGSGKDVLIVISGSGDSPNVVLGLVEARRISMRTFGILGFAGGQAITLCQHSILVGSTEYGCIEDAHSALIHAVDAFLGSVSKSQAP